MKHQRLLLRQICGKKICRLHSGKKAIVKVLVELLASRKQQEIVKYKTVETMWNSYSGLVNKGDETTVVLQRT